MSWHLRPLGWRLVNAVLYQHWTPCHPHKWVARDHFGSIRCSKCGAWKRKVVYDGQIDKDFK